MSLVGYKRRAEATTHEGEVFEKLDLRSMKAFGSKWTGCSFVDCQMNLADWRASRFEQCTFIRCEAERVDFSTSLFEKVVLLDCNFEQAWFTGSHLRDVDFDRCRLAYGETMFQDATFKGRVRFHDCNLHGSNLDFREVEPGALSFDGCNMWGVKISMGCAIFNPGTLDDRTVKQFLALVARVAQDSRIAELAGDQYAVVNRAMDGGAKQCHSMKASRATSTPIPSFQVQTATTANVATPPTTYTMRTTE